MGDPIDPTAARPRSRCPICNRPTDPATRPFCSRRCADIDLHRWLSGSYVVPGAHLNDDQSQKPEEPSDTL